MVMSSAYEELWYVCITYFCTPVFCNHVLEVLLIYERHLRQTNFAETNEKVQEIAKREHQKLKSFFALKSFKFEVNVNYVFSALDNM